MGFQYETQFLDSWFEMEHCELYRVYTIINIHLSHVEGLHLILCGISNAKYIAYSTVTCETLVPLDEDLAVDGLDGKLPRGWYRIGPLQIRHDHGWFNLYRRRATGAGYWDFYTMVPERDCTGWVDLGEQKLNTLLGCRESF